MKRMIKQAVAVVLAGMMLLLCFTGCASKGETLMKLEDETLTVNLYELYLSRMKGALASAYSFGSKALTDSFWDTVMSTDGTTYNTYYTNQVLESAKTYLAALYAFEQKGLELPKETEDAIEETLKKLMEEDANGSKSQFNSILSQYGVNYNILMEAHIIDAKITYLKNSMYGVNGGLIADNLIEEYYQKTYARFKQVFLYTYDYVYYTDGDGEAIYYKEDGKTIAYDTKATPKTDSSGKEVLDANGDRVYVNEDGTIAYDKQNGERKHKTAEDGSALVENLTGDRLNEVLDQAVQIEGMVQANDFSSFDELVEKYSLDVGMEKYPGGYYLTADTNYDSPEVVEKLFTMEVGEWATVRSDYGIHIIMRYEMEEAAYDKSEYEDFFISNTTGTYVFMEDMKNFLLSEYLEQFKANIVIDTAVLAQIDIKRASANFYY